jgi:hypothetical protein
MHIPAKQSFRFQMEHPRRRPVDERIVSLRIQAADTLACGVEQAPMVVRHKFDFHFQQVSIQEVSCGDIRLGYWYFLLMAFLIPCP